jgi:perosamine synthetase
VKARIPLSAPDITEAEIEAVAAVLRTPYLSLGPEIEAFERALAEYHAVNYAVAVSSGTAGLHLALLVLGVGAGDEVIIPSFAFVAVANAVLQVRATPVFAEIDPVTLNLDPASVEASITSRTRAVLAVHRFGVPAEMDAIEAIARRHGLTVIEDACEAVGAKYGEGAGARRAGAFGDLAVLGFYPNKQLTTGEGGAVLCRDVARARRLRSLRNQGRNCDSFASSGAAENGDSRRPDWLDHDQPGYNYRLSEMACALGRVQLSRLDEMLSLRGAAAKRYDGMLAGIPGLVRPPIELPHRTISWFVYAVRLPAEVDRDRARSVLATRGIATGRYFPPIHLQPAWRAHSNAAVTLPVTEAIAPRMLALPFFNRIEADQQQEVAEALGEAISG